MEKLEIKSGENQLTVGANLTGIGTTESPVGYTGDIQHSDKRSLLWESTGNDYNTNITLSEPVTHFDQIIIYGSGLEGADTMHVSKNVYKTQDKLMGCDTWCYSPWTTAFQANYILAANLKISGNSGHIGGSMYWGIGSKNATWAAGKWTGTEAPKMLMPWKIFGLGRHPIYNFYGLDSDGGSVASNIPSGYSGDTATLTVTPSGDEWKLSALNITGAELTGNNFMFGNSNVTASAGFEHSRDLTLVNSEHGVLSADKMSGFSGDVVTVDATTDEGWYFTGLNITGATATGNQFMFIGENVTAEGLYTDEGYPITYLSDDHVQCTGDTTIYIPGGTGITLHTGYDTYYRISGYDVTGGTVENGVLIPTGPCTVKAVQKVNYFTATGNFEKGSNQSVAGTATQKKVTWGYANVAEKYALHQSHTGDIPASWYATSNRWKPSNVSSYSITLNAKMQFTGRKNKDYNGATAAMTGVTMVGSTQNQLQTFTVDSTAATTRSYSKTVTTTTQNVFYGVSSRIGAAGYNAGGIARVGTATYIATGTWTATGIAP